MSATTEQIFIEALSLPNKPRGGLALRLLESLDSKSKTGSHSSLRTKNMSRIVEKICGKTLRLPFDAREELVRRLILSIEEEDYDADAEDKWRKEISRRIQQVRSGKAKLIPAEEIWRHVNAVLKRTRANREMRTPA